MDIDKLKKKILEIKTRKNILETKIETLAVELQALQEKTGLISTDDIAAQIKQNNNEIRTIISVADKILLKVKENDGI